MNNAVEVSHLTKIFPAAGERAAVTAVNDVSLAILPGSVTAVLGPNGAGKTTLIEMMLGMLSPTRGSVRVLGHAPDQRCVRSRVGAMMQDTDAPRSLTVGESIDLVGHYYPHPLPVADVLELTDLASKRHTLVSQLSGGQRQRLNYAIAIVGDPKILYLDEPTAALDVLARSRFWDALETFTTRGTTVIFSSHNLAEVESVAQRVVMISDGRIIADGSPADLARRSARMVMSFESDEPVERYQRLAGVLTAESSRNGIRLFTANGDDSVAALVGSGLPFTNLTIERASLQDAFVHLMSQKVEAA